MVSLKPPFWAEDMSGLFKKVTKGVIPAIPKKYSQEVLAIIKALIQVDPKKRPNCDEILAFPLVKKKIKEYHLMEDDEIMQSPELESNLL